MFVYLVIKHAKCVRHNVNWPVRQYSNLARYILDGRILKEKLLNVKFCFDFLYSVCMKRF